MAVVKARRCGHIKEKMLNICPFLLFFARTFLIIPTFRDSKSISSASPLLKKGSDPIGLPGI